jgi:hypothetical protein
LVVAIDDKPEVDAKGCNKIHKEEKKNKLCNLFRANFKLLTCVPDPKAKKKRIPIP